MCFCFKTHNAPNHNPVPVTMACGDHLLWHKLAQISVTQGLTHTNSKRSEYHHRQSDAGKNGQGSSHHPNIPFKPRPGGLVLYKVQVHPV